MLLVKNKIVIDDKNAKLKQHAIYILTRNHEKVLSNGRTPLAKLVLQGYMHLLFKHAPPVNLHSREAAWPECWFSEHLPPATREKALRLPSHWHIWVSSAMGLCFTGLMPNPVCLSTELGYSHHARRHQGCKRNVAAS